MKAFISLLLSASLLLEGCHSFYALDEKAAQQLRGLDNQSIEVRLSDGRAIESDAYQHVAITESSHVVVRTGSRYTGPVDRIVAFNGVAQWSAIDSSRALPETEGRSLRC
jgi:hypothetical protein